MTQELVDELRRIAAALEARAPALDVTEVTDAAGDSDSASRRIRWAPGGAALATAAVVIVVGLGAIAVNRSDRETLLDEPAVTAIIATTAVEREACDKCAPQTTVHLVPDAAPLVDSDKEIAETDWVALDPLPAGFEAVLTDDHRVVYLTETDASFVVSTMIADDPSGDGDTWARREIGDGTMEYSRTLGSNATVSVTVHGIDDATSRALLNKLSLMDGRPAALLNQQGSFEDVGSFDAGITPVGVAVQIADPWFCIETTTSMGPQSVSCGLQRSDGPVTVNASHSAQKGSSVVRTRIDGSATNDVALVTSTFSDGHTVDVTPQPVAGHPGWNFWAIETETMHESYDPRSDIVLVSVTAHNAVGDVLAAVSE